MEKKKIKTGLIGQHGQSKEERGRPLSPSWSPSSSTVATPFLSARSSSAQSSRLSSLSLSPSFSLSLLGFSLFHYLSLSLRASSIATVSCSTTDMRQSSSFRGRRSGGPQFLGRSTITVGGGVRRMGRSWTHSIDPSFSSQPTGGSKCKSIPCGLLIVMIPSTRDESA